MPASNRCGALAHAQMAHIARTCDIARGAQRSRRLEQVNGRGPNAVYAPEPRCQSTSNLRASSGPARRRSGHGRSRGGPFRRRARTFAWRLPLLQKPRPGLQHRGTRAAAHALWREGSVRGNHSHVRQMRMYGNGLDHLYKQRLYDHPERTVRNYKSNNISWCAVWRTNSSFSITLRSPSHLEEEPQNTRGTQLRLDAQNERSQDQRQNGGIA